MRIPASTIVLSTVLMASGCASGSTAAGELSADDRAALEHIAERDAEVVLARDWEALAERFADDAVRMPPNAPAIHGRSAIRESVAMMPPIAAFSFRMTSLAGNGRIAYMRAEWSYTLEPPGAEAIVDLGKILIVFEKQEDGRWLTVADAWNSDLPVGS